MFYIWLWKTLLVVLTCIVLWDNSVLTLDGVRRSLCIVSSSRAITLYTISFFNFKLNCSVVTYIFNLFVKKRYIYIYIYIYSLYVCVRTLSVVISSACNVVSVVYACGWLAVVYFYIYTNNVYRAIQSRSLSNYFEHFHCHRYEINITYTEYRKSIDC